MIKNNIYLKKEKILIDYEYIILTKLLKEHSFFNKIR